MVGGLIGNPFSTKKGLLISGTDINSIKDNGMYLLSGGTFEDLQSNSYGFLLVFTYNSTTLQIHASATSLGGKTLMRQCYMDKWTEWVVIN